MRHTMQYWGRWMRANMTWESEGTSDEFAIRFSENRALPSDDLPCHATFLLRFLMAFQHVTP
jgi:hypothetical protein